MGMYTGEDEGVAASFDYFICWLAISTMGLKSIINVNSFSTGCFDCLNLIELNVIKMFYSKRVFFIIH